MCYERFQYADSPTGLQIEIWIDELKLNVDGYEISGIVSKTFREFIEEFDTVIVSARESTIYQIPLHHTPPDISKIIWGDSVIGLTKEEFDSYTILTYGEEKCLQITKLNWFL